MPIYCHRNDKGFLGDDMGLSQRFCNDFFVSPTDMGMCLTRNLNLNQIMKFNDEYEPLFESKEHSNEEIERGSKWGQLNFIFLLPSINNEGVTYRNVNQRTASLKLQLHSTKEIGNLRQPDDFDFFTIPIELEKNNEYFIKVTPYGTKSSEAINDLPLEKRNCKLDSEVSEDSVFKVYSEKNCRYECHVEIAVKTCNCTPWDFISKEGKRECDIFGRTCFYNSMENVLLNDSNLCDHCLKNCDFLEFRKELISKEEISTVEDHYEYGILEDVSIQGKYFNCYSKFMKGCNGLDVIYDFIGNPNNTMEDKGAENLYDSRKGKVGKYFLHNRLLNVKNLVIVHLNFMKPEIDFLDLKYSTLDKVANFGGKFGIFAQLTGCSFLAILNILLVVFKCFFSQQG